MPIYIETPQTLNADDINDLQKIYVDYPVESAHQRLNDWHTSLANNWQLCVARFNARLLGAMWLKNSENNILLVHDICVRKITRRRGVGERLLSVTLEQATQENKYLEITAPPAEISDTQAIEGIAQKLKLILHTL